MLDGLTLAIFFVDFRQRNVYFCFTSNENCHFSSENADTAKRVVDFPLEQDTFRNKTMEIVEDFDERSYNNNGKPWKSSRILRVNPNFFIFLSFFNCFLHFFVFFFFFIFSCFSIFPIFFIFLIFSHFSQFFIYFIFSFFHFCHYFLDFIFTFFFNFSFFFIFFHFMS